jgi:adenylylsulfate kinase
MKILICGLPGSGKTTLAERIAPALNAVHLNADKVREEANDWDFSPEGRTRQANRMKTMADEAVAKNRVVVADFICPTQQTRDDFNADYTIWMNTINEGRYEDTNKMFQPVKEANFVCEYKDATTLGYLILQELRDKIQEEKNEHRSSE